MEDIFFASIREDFARLDKRIERLDYPGNKKPTDLWLPNLIFASAGIQLVTYLSRSVSVVTKEVARGFLKKSLSNKKLADGDYYLARPPVRDYRLRVVDHESLSKSESVRLNRCNWTVCFMPGNAESVSFKTKTVHPNNLERRKMLTNVDLEIVARHKGTTLYFCKGPKADSEKDSDDW
jgi:hypothetical protein